MPRPGLGSNNCDDDATSRQNGSNCTPKGNRKVEGFADFLSDDPHCQFVTWFDLSRGIAFHSHHHVPKFPASHGCVRLHPHAAQLIHNNAQQNSTQVTVSGTWRRGH